MLELSIYATLLTFAMTFSPRNGPIMGIRRMAVNFQEPLFATEQNDLPERTLQDYVLNVHGGKYQFDTSGGTTVGRDFASMLYGSRDECDPLPKDPPFEEWPHWAKNMASRDFSNHILEAIQVTSDGVLTKVSITNQYRTWEPYYSCICQPQDGVFEIMSGTSHGTLAPKGGAANACDVSKPYSDTATVSIRCLADAIQHFDPNDDYFLVIGTEEEKWYYRLELTNNC